MLSETDRERLKINNKQLDRCISPVLKPGVTQAGNGV
jgi:hypothetical protein